MSDSTILQELDLLTILGQQYNPCTSDEPLSFYIRQEKNGPFLRPLCLIWRQMGSPHLTSLQSFNSMANDDYQEEVTLATLSLQQELTIASFIRHSYTSKAAFTALQSFSMFASQLDLFCKIKTELFGLKDEVQENKLDSLYRCIWQTSIQEFVQQKESTCASSENKHDYCLGRLVWGEVFDWSSSALYFAFVGYLEQVKMQSEDQSKDVIFPVASSSSSSASMTSTSNPFTPASSFADSQGFPSPSCLDPAIQGSHIQVSDIEPFGFIVGGGSTTFTKDYFLDPSTSSFIQSRRPTWTDFFHTNMIAHFLDSNIELSQQQKIDAIDQENTSETQSTSQSEIGEDFFDVNSTRFNQQYQQQHLIAESSFSPTSTPLCNHELIPSPIRPKMNRSRSSSSSIAKKQATSERSKRHYMKAKAERNVLTNICAKLNDLTSELQISPRLHRTKVTQTMIQARLASNGYNEVARLPTKRSSTENDPNKRKRESKLRKRNEDLQNAERLIGYARTIVGISFPHLLDRIAFIDSHFIRTNNPEDEALDKVLQLWLQFEHSWKEILEGVQRLSKTEASTLDHPVEMAIRILRAACTS